MSTTIRPSRGRVPGWEYSILIRWPDGQRTRERANAPVKSKSAATRWAQAREQHIISLGREGYEATKSKVPVVKPETLAEFWPRFMRDHYHANRKKPSTIEEAERIFRLHLGPQLGTKPLHAITTADVAVLKGTLAKRSPKTVNNILSVLSRALHSAIDWGMLTVMPCKLNLLKTTEGQPDWYELHDYRRLVDAAAKLSTSHLVLVLLAGSAGLRRGEIIALKWSDLDLGRRQMRVDRAIWRGHEESPKGGRGRALPLTPELAEALKRHKHLRGDRVIYSDKGRELSNRAIRNMLGKIQRRAGLAVTGGIHFLRHTFCSHLAAAGAPAKAIQELAGHTDLKTTQRYMHLSVSDRGGAMDRLQSYYTEANQDAHSPRDSRSDRKGSVQVLSQGGRRAD